MILRGGGENEYPGYNGFTDYNLANSSCIIVRQENNIITTNTFLPKSIQLYAVDEYFLVNRVSLSGSQINDLRVNWNGKTTRNYAYGAVMVVTTIIWNPLVHITGSTLLNLYHIDPVTNTKNRVQYTLSTIQVEYSTCKYVYFTYQPQKPDEYPDSKFWNMLEIQIGGKRIDPAEYIFVCQVIIMYVPTGYNYM